MEATKSKTPGRIMRGVVILGAIGISVIASACSSEKEESKQEEQKKCSTTIDQVANDPNVEMPVDATPSPDGKDIYFVAHSKVALALEDGPGFERQAGVFKVSASGGP